MKIGRGRWGFGVALAAALMLMLQTMTGAWAMGANPNPQTDIFGNMLCVTSDAGHGIPDSGGHSKNDDCCVAGCSMFSSVASAPSDAVWIDAPRSVQRFDRIGAVDAELPVADYSPGNPRAPPPTV